MARSDGTNEDTGLFNVRGRRVYRGPKGGLYVLAGGRKVYKPKVAGGTPPAPARAAATPASGATGMTNVLGRPVFRGPRGGLYVVHRGRKVYNPKVNPTVPKVPKVKPTVNATPLARRLAANALGRRAALVPFAATAVAAARRARAPPRAGAADGVRGLGPGLPFAKDADGTDALDPVTLNRIPAARAVAVDKKIFDARTLRGLLAGDAAAPNPVTRGPLPDDIRRRYGPRPRVDHAPGPARFATLDAAARVLSAAWAAAPEPELGSVDAMGAAMARVRRDLGVVAVFDDEAAGATGSAGPSGLIRLRHPRQPLDEVVLLQARGARALKVVHLSKGRVVRG